VAANHNALAHSNVTRANAYPANGASQPSLNFELPLAS
jgi:hypothetical protein